MSNSPWYSDPSAVDSVAGNSPASQSTPNSGSHIMSGATQAKIANISRLPAGKNRVDQVLSLVHELDPREYNRLVETLTFEEQDELTQRLLKIRKKKNQKATEGKSNWYLSVPQDEERSAWQIILWWEARRLPYNLMVGLAGLVNSTAIMMAGHSDPFSYFPYFLNAILYYAVAANFCYTGGWMTELISRRVWAEKAQHFGTIALGLGTAFSVFITLIPAAIITLVFILHLIGLG